MNTRPFFALLALSLAIGASAQTIDPTKLKPKKQFWGIELGAYLPTDGAVRDELGDALWRIGVSPVSSRFSKKVTFGPDINLLWATNSNDSRLFLLPVTLVATIGLGMNETTETYLAVGAGPAYFDYSLVRVTEAPKDGLVATRYKDKGITGNVNAEVGLLFNKRLSVKGRYDYYPELDGFDFSGFSLSVNYAFLKW